MANQALEHGYACIYSTECLLFVSTSPIWWMDRENNSKNPSQHEVVVLSSGGAPWDIIGCLRRQKLVMRVPETESVLFDLLVHCNDEFLLVISEHQQLHLCFLNYDRAGIIPDLQSGFTVYSNWVSRWMHMIGGAVMLHDGAAGSRPGGMLQGSVVARTFSFKL